MIRNLDVALVRTFVATADHASMTAAGNALNLTQSTVSQQVARLEELCGSLFIRGPRSLRLTPVGERLLGPARRLLAVNDELWREMTPMLLSSPVRVGAPHDLVATWLTPILKAFAATCPGAEIALVCKASPELVADVDDGLLDLALVEEPLGATRGTCLIIDRLVWVGTRGGVAHRAVPLPISLVAETCAFRPAVLDALRDRGLAWRTLFENGSLDATAATVRADLAVTAWLASTVPSDLEPLPAEAGLPELPLFAINLYRGSGEATPGATELERHIQRRLVRRPALA